MTENSSGSGNEAEFSDRVFRMVSALALALGAISGGYTVSTSDDRYRAADAQKDFALRDQKISQLDREIEWLKSSIERIDRSGTSVGNAAYGAMLRDHEDRIDRIEKQK